MANLGEELANIIGIPSGDDISNASSHTNVVDPEIKFIYTFLDILPLANFIVLSDNYKSLVMNL